jgi:tRNA1(Val) A37 N6-methylase TrmN6
MDDACAVYSDETVDEFAGLKVIQKIGGPRFSLDAILLARFATVKKGDVVVDLGAGGGIVSLILATATEADRIVGIEIQSELADIARRNAILNRLEDKIHIVEEDLRAATEIHPAGQFDLLVSNPPYRRLGDGRINPDPLKAIARHEIKCTLEDVLRASFHLLKNRGRATFVYRPDRIADLITGCRNHRLEPKTAQFVHPGHDRDANLVLLQAIKNAQQGLKVLKPLMVSKHQIP